MFPTYLTPTLYCALLVALYSGPFIASSFSSKPSFPHAMPACRVCQRLLCRNEPLTVSLLQIFLLFANLFKYLDSHGVYRNPYMISSLPDAHYDANIVGCGLYKSLLPLLWCLLMPLFCILTRMHFTKQYSIANQGIQML